MKKKIVLLSALMLATTIYFSVTVIAKQETTWEYYAYGTLDHYDAATSAIVVHGFWNLKVQGDKVFFDGYYLEENLDAEIEGAPVGSVDIFKWELIGKPIDMWMNGDTLYIFSKIQTKKTAAQPDGTYQTHTIENWQMLVFDFNTETFLRDVYPPDPEKGPPPPGWQDWDVRGTMTRYSYPQA